MTDIDKLVAEAVERGFRVLDDPHLEVPAEYDSAEEHALNESARHAYAAGLEAAAKVAHRKRMKAGHTPGVTDAHEQKRVWDERRETALEIEQAIRALKEGE